MISKINLIGLTIILALVSGTSNDITFDGLPTIDKIFAQESKLPDWIKNIFVWYGQDQISENEILNAIKFLVENNIIEIKQNTMPSSMDSSMMDSMMSDSSMMDDSSMMSSMPFNPEVPITIPMIDGYYNDEKVFFIHTETSDQKMANMMSMMVNFPTIYVSDLENIPEEDLGKFYVFTNGIPGTGPYGGGPFMFQIDIFDSVPGQDGYSEFKIPQLVTWNENSTPRLLTSVDELLQAETNGELSIQPADFVVNLPMLIWDSGTKKQVEHIEKPFTTMPKFDAKVINLDENNYTVTLQFHPLGSMDMMN